MSTPEPIQRERDAGFTLVETMVALLLMAIVFVALAGVMLSSMEAISVQKGRTRANELATQGIEDLQRYDFDALGLCPGSIAPNAPAELSDAVILSGCTGSIQYGDPCGPTPAATGAALVPKGQYMCNRSGIDPVEYEVRRYIGWADPAHTTKRLAVYVDWTDIAGRHQVSQQSSLKAPDPGAVIGLGPPVIRNIAVQVTNDPLQLTSDPGQLVSGQSATVRAEIANISPCPSSCPDFVYASIQTLDPAYDFSPRTDAIQMAYDSATDRWEGTLTDGDGFTFGSGTQYVKVGILRDLDGMENSSVAGGSLLRFCPVTDPSCSTVKNPTIDAPTGYVQGAFTIPPIHISPAGELLDDVVLSGIKSKHLTASDFATLTFQTRSGAQSVALSRTGPCSKPDPATTNCNWAVTIPRSAGYLFDSTSPQNWFVAGRQVFTADTTDEDHGRTVAREFSVTFQVN